MLPGSRFNDSAYVQDHYHPFPSGVIRLVKVHKEFPFFRPQFKVSLQAAVLAFSGLAAENHHGHIVHRGLILDGRRGESRFFAVLAVFLILQIKACLQGLGLQGIVTPELFVQGETGRFQGLRHSNHIGLVDFSRTGSAGDEILAGNPVQGHPFVPFERQRVPLVAKEDNGLGRCFPRSEGVGLEVGPVGIRIAAKMRRFHHVFQDAAHIAVHLLHRETAVFHAFQNALYFHIGPGVHQVVAGLHGQHGIVFEPPVRDYDSLVAPLIAEHGGKEVFVLLGVLSVQLVVRAHYRPGGSFLHGNLEVLEIDFPQGAATDEGVVLYPVGFLAVGCIVLDGSAGSVTLDAPHIGGGHLAGQQRIFGEILEVPSVERVAVDVHTGGQEHIHPILQHLVPQHGGGAFHQVRIPGAGQQRSHREARSHFLLRIPFRVYAHPGGAVGEDGLGNLQPGNGPGASRHSGHQVVRAGSYQQRGLFLKRHSLQDFINIIGPQPGLGGSPRRKNDGQSENKKNLPLSHSLRIINSH